MESGFRSTDWQQLTFAVVGMGLIGGSYAKALRRLGVNKIIGVDTDGKVLRGSGTGCYRRSSLRGRGRTAGGRCSDLFGLSGSYAGFCKKCGAFFAE